MEKRSRLGRGLNSLLNSTPEPAEILPAEASISAKVDSLHATDVQNAPSTEMLHVELSKVVPNPNQPRRRFNEESLATLAASIKAAGLIQPIIVRRVEDKYEVIAGERRWRAAKLAGLTTLPVIIRTVDTLKQSQLALIENIHREDLNPIDRAIAYKEIIRQTGVTQAELGNQLGEDRSAIGHYIRLLDLPEKTQDLVSEGRLNMGHAKILSSIEDLDEVSKLTQLVISQNLSVRSLEKVIKDRVGSKDSVTPKSQSPHLTDLERQLSRELQMRAEVKQAKKSGKGRLVIHYASLDQFDELISRLGVKIED